MPEAINYSDTASVADNPSLCHLGIRLEEISEGRAIFSLDVNERHRNRIGSLQGGVIATLLDAACGYAGLYEATGKPLQNAVTVTLTINYLRKASGGTLRAVGTVTKAGRKIYFATSELVNEAGELIATAQGAFMRAVQPGP
ncbi:PaaI family thioesterase [Cupriavidus oxalaticus]|uniref:Medium/long-chain acyl-CoA thioesterase YigI n=1 Tax=Cupriavidus oxalaticus TaxID=96344 RepID=A0A4P7LUU8_9BURK|nr:PaaI family thioesterase [Cupriavidus oxalaticus]QBY56251.1 PaaI family thioesterase [Cupriavidus oxalaticus]